jgi:hypothetical protein
MHGHMNAKLWKDSTNLMFNKDLLYQLMHKHVV